jgi:acetylornithine/LysW-gamma-L-lysine aminotransferase
MLNSDEIKTLENRHESGVYGKIDIVLVRGEGARLWDADGKVYIDCMSGHGVANIGHANPAVAKAIAEQAQRLITCHSALYNEQRALLMQKLAQIAPPGLDRFFLCNSGAEAVEGALKFARLHGSRLSNGRTKIISTMRGFHGRTFGALSATWNKEYREPFEPLVPGFEFVPYNKLERMEQAIDDETAAVIIEVVQGEGGVNPGVGDYLRGVQALCQERGALFIADEVQTGFGRTGKMFACEHYDLRPDLMTVAKGIAGGLPMGAILIGPRVGEIPQRVHNNTFGANPLCCAAAVAAIDFMLAENLPQRAAEMGARMMDGFKAIESPLIREVRGLGLIVGIELKQPSASYLAQLAEKGVLALNAGSTVMRFLPPLVIGAEDVDTVVEKVAEVLPAA